VDNIISSLNLTLPCILGYCSLLSIDFALCQNNMSLLTTSGDAGLKNSNTDQHIVAAGIVVDELK